MDKKFFRIKDMYVTNSLSNFPTSILIAENDDIYISRQNPSSSGGWSYDVRRMSDKERNNIKSTIESELLEEHKFEFKKCAFCGSYEVKYASDETPNIDYDYCICINCDSTSPKSTTEVYKNADKAKYEAKIKWNKRS